MTALVAPVASAEVMVDLSKACTHAPDHDIRVLAGVQTVDRAVYDIAHARETCERNGEVGLGLFSSTLP